MWDALDVAKDNDSSRVDGVIIVPWSRVSQLAWDATCVDPLCSSNILRSSKAVGAAVEKAVRNKRRDYSSVCSQ